MATVIDILPRIISDALDRSSHAYRANDTKAGDAHFKRFDRLWDQAIQRTDLYSTDDWKKLS